MISTHVSTPRRTTAAGLSRRSALRGLGGVAAASLAVAGLGPGRRQRLARAQTPAQTPAAEPFLGETYVGDTSEPYLLAAAVIGAAAPDGAAREARAYVCKTPVHMPGGIDEWLTGTLTDDVLDLQSENGVGLTGQLAEGAVTGTVTMADGSPIALLATRARGVAGLYIGARVNRLLQASSAEGGYFEELVAAVPDETFVLPNYWQIGDDRQPFPASGLATPPTGSPVVLTTYYDQKNRQRPTAGHRPQRRGAQRGRQRPGGRVHLPRHRFLARSRPGSCRGRLEWGSDVDPHASVVPTGAASGKPARQPSARPHWRPT